MSLSKLPTHVPIFLLRHGQTEWNREGRLQGHRDSALTETGIAQAEAQRNILAPILRHLPDIAIHASPLGRAWHTAQIAADGHPVTAKEALKEVSAGSWEGRLRADVVAEQGFGSAEEKDMFRLFLNAPGGEGEAALRQRCTAYLAGLTAPTVVVAHGVVSALLRGLLCDLTLEEIASLPHRQGVVTAVCAGQVESLCDPQTALGYLSHCPQSPPVSL